MFSALIRSLVPVAAAAAILAAGAETFAQSSITLFGQGYRVQRFNYADQVRLPSVFPNDPSIPFIESEGLQWIGNNKLLMSADDISDIAFGNPDNWVVEVSLLTSPAGQITGLSYSRAIVTSDPSVAGFDLNPTGVTVNTSSTGVGAGGNVVALNGDGILYGYGLATPPVGGALTTLDLSAFNANAEDIAFVPAVGTRGPAFVLINQDTSRVERYSTTGTPEGSFPIGSALPAGSPFLVAKGVTYIPNSPKLPPALRQPQGIIMVAFDDSFPALQAFDLDGNLLGTELLTANGTVTGTPRLDTAGCSRRLQLESLTSDPLTGRLFLSNQGVLTECGYLFVLTPTCPADINADGNVSVQDIFDFLSAWFAGDTRADFNRVGGVTVQDIFDFLSAWFAGC